MRKPYLDHLRWAAVLLVLVYHVGYLFTAAGIPGSIGAQADLKAFNAFSVFCTMAVNFR